MTAAVTRFPHTMIRASAGTGKTFQLSNRYLGLAAGGVPADQILATTFTRKAAGEILERVLTRLAQAADDPRKARELGHFMAADDLSCDRARQTLEALVQNLHRVRISTLDAFFAQLARSFDLELGLPPGWRIAEESADARLRGEAIQAVLAGEPQYTLRLLHLLSKGEATRSIGEQLRTLVNGLYGLYQETTEEAWNSLKRPPRLADDKLQAAIEALAAAPLSGNKRFATARESDLAKARAGDWKGFIAAGLAKAVIGRENYFGKPIDGDLAQRYQTLIRHAQGALVGQLADQTHATWQFLHEFDAKYRPLKGARRALRFDDITRALAGSALCERWRELSFRLDARITHLLLDEFQDTSLSQWKVLCPLAGETMSLAEGGGSFFCVGDVKQAIYGWRGGEAELFDAVGAAWPDLNQPSLSRSQRSAAPIIETVNRVFADVAVNPALDSFNSAAAAWARGYQTHTTAKEHLGYARMVTAPAAEDATDQPAATLDFAANEIARLVAEAPGRTVGALVRDNNAVASLIYKLRQKNVSASEEGGNPLTDSPAVALILSLLTLADHPGDKAARFHVARSPLGEAIGFTDDASQRQAERLSLRIRAQLVTRGYGATLYRWARDLAEHCDPRDASRLLQLVELAYRFDPEAGLRTRDFVAFVERQRVEAPSPAAVRVMTIHQAKGLQFDIVALPQLDVKFRGQTPAVVVGRPQATAAANLVCRYANDALRNLLPEEAQAAFARDCEQDIRESLCVLYVALTRPIHALHMIVAPSKCGEKKLPATMSGVLRGALTDGAPLPAETVVYERGDREWHAHSPPSAAPPEVSEELWPQKPAFQVALAPASQRRRRGLQRESPSGLASAAKVDLATRMVLETGRAANRGSVFHAWLEQIEWLEGGEPDDSLLRRIGRQAGASEQELAEWLGQFRSKLRNSGLRAALSRGSYLAPANAPWAKRAEILADLAGSPGEIEVFRERPFAVRLRDTLLSGTFDRLVLVRCRADEAPSSFLAEASSPSRSGRPAAVKERAVSPSPTAQGAIAVAEVLDYKTDAVSPGDRQAAANIVARYRPQLGAYRQAVSNIFGIAPERVITRLMLLEIDEAVEVE